MLGQERVLVAWNRIVFPDASTLEIGAMSGAGQDGYRCFRDQVNHHYFRIFGNAILLSLIGAGIQLSQPQPENNGHYLAPQQQIAASLGQQMGQVGMEMVRRNM